MANDEYQYPHENHKMALVRSFDAASESLKTTITNAAVEINVSAFTDSIKIADASGNAVTVTTVGAKKGLDINVLDLKIDAVNDSIAIKNGTNQLAINADGSINATITEAPKGFSTVSNVGQILVTTSSTTVLAANIIRKYFHLVNNSNATVYIQYGSAAQINKGIKLNVGALLMISGNELFLGQINAISTSSINLDYLEGT
jgi:hypothetical protein